MCIILSQFEALTRAMWLFYATSDDKLDSRVNITQKLTSSADQKPNNADMIKTLEGKAPEDAVKMLKDFRDVQWKALNSYVHAGAHVMLRHGEGYPVELLERIIKSSNGLLSVTAMMAAILTRNKIITKDTAAIQKRHVDCLPELLPNN
ncbi:hypothetical protein [Paraglaciecola sp. 20A4]|uniref:DUF6988 family protein n=1 Tax=Paraglaciecola sp. 20A4 TaxID=2687288 RepID=UPI001F0FC6DE|nr:hypothetical protein [Paraglaciecola sp. 20A4]